MMMTFSLIKYSEHSTYNENSSSSSSKIDFRLCGAGLNDCFLCLGLLSMFRSPSMSSMLSPTTLPRGGGPHFRRPGFDAPPNGSFLY